MARGRARAFSLIGFAGASHIDTAGLERNPLVALVRTSLPRVSARSADADWRAHHRPARFGRRAHAPPLHGRARNVLLVVLESTGARYLRPFGAAEDPMPNLSALASHAIVFENAYAVYPESIKGFVSNFRVLATGVRRSGGTLRRPLSRPSLATALGSDGYATALFHSGRFMYLGMEPVVARSGFARSRKTPERSAVTAIRFRHRRSRSRPPNSRLDRLGTAHTPILRPPTASRWASSCTVPRSPARSPIARTSAATGTPSPTAIHALGTLLAGLRAATSTGSTLDCRAWRSRRGVGQNAWKLRPHACDLRRKHPCATAHCRHPAYWIPSSGSGARKPARRRTHGARLLASHHPRRVFRANLCQRPLAHVLFLPHYRSGCSAS